ncbi:MOSC domain-containing protein [Bacillus weihaiensis]|uniref:Sulfurase n=1 Tax=Bacillus weihaiensis TaxID=1547283 RepID=A0A1L3MR42_9BACI|nr:MOSC domain-containing protein [Bacillus weihaiensis]APH04796.1 sulfurase [Bacillus weihaiensis]
MVVGYLKEITRYPVKSMNGQKVHETKIMNYGLYGDRSHAYLDLTREDKFLTITQFPKMAQYRAAFRSADCESRFPVVEITTPEGQQYEWNDPSLLKELEQRCERNIQPIHFEPAHVPFGAIEEEHILIVNEKSVQALENLWGEKIDYVRFRPNLLVSLNDEPYFEETMFGKRVKIGQEVELEILRHCERCMIVNVDPDTGEISHSLLKTVVKERRNHFGVYARVIKTGLIKAGDEVTLLD